MSGTVSLLPPAEQQFCDANGAPLAGGSVATYVPGTTTPATTWQDSAGTTPNTNPIILDAAGRAIIWGAGSYRMVVKDVSGNLIYDQVTAAASSTLSQLTVTGAVSVGGALTSGATTVGTLTAGATTLNSMTVEQSATSNTTQAVSVTRTNGTDTDLSPIANVEQTIAWSGVANPTTGAQSTALQVTSNVGNQYSGGVYVDAPGNNAYNFAASLNSTACNWSGVGSSPFAASQHVAAASAVVRSLPPGGVPAGKKMAQCWAHWMPVSDTTQLPSSTANALLGIEMDMEAGNTDDGNNRAGIIMVATPSVPLTSGGYPAEIGVGIGFVGHVSQPGGANQFDGFFKSVLQAGGPFSISCVDTRGSQRLDTTVKTTLSAPSATVAVNNVWGFTSAGTYRNPVSASNPAAIKINGTSYTQTGFTSDGPGTTSGTITLTTNVSVADGTAGNAVNGASHTIWMNTGDDIAMTLDGGTRIAADTSGRLNFFSLDEQVMQLGAGGEALVVGSLTVKGSLGLFNFSAPATQPTVAGSRGGNAALASLLTALAAYGLIIDGTTA